jgi:hypothetical protein
MRSLTVLLVAVVAHVGVYLIRHLGARLTRSEATASVRKLRTVITLATSIAVFTVYFTALGFFFNEIGIPLTAYLASALGHWPGRWFRLPGRGSGCGHRGDADLCRSAGRG